MEKAREILSLAAAGGLPIPLPAPQIRTIADVRLRRGAPSTMVPVVAIIPSGTTVTPKWFVTGDSVKSNPNWYLDAAGDFFWAGATTVPNPA